MVGASGPQNPELADSYQAKGYFLYDAAVKGETVYIGEQFGMTIFRGPSWCNGTTGNIDDVGIVDLPDLSRLIGYLIGTGSLVCYGEADINQSGVIDLADLSTLVAHLTVPHLTSRCCRGVSEAAGAPQDDLHLGIAIKDLIGHIALEIAPKTRSQRDNDMASRKSVASKATETSHETSSTVPLMLYGITVLLFLIGSFVPQTRLWGAAPWGYYSVPARLIFTLMAAVIPLVWYVITRKPGEAGEPNSRGTRLTSIVLLVGMPVLCGVLFYLFKAETFFLGDGYTSLSNLASMHPIVKGRSLGTGLVYVWVSRLLGGFSQENALASFRIVSIAAGVLFVPAVVWTALKLFAGLRDQLLFIAGCLSGGYLLLFFGYVEHYPLFALAVMVFTLSGVLAARRLLPKWVILVPMATAIFFHIFGVALLPAAIYLFLKDTTVGKSVGRFRRATWIALGTAALLIGSVVIYQLAQSSMFFRIAILLPVASQFTVEGYTLLAPSHLADVISLLLMLVPGLLVGVAVLVTQCRNGTLAAPEFRFLAITAVACIGLVFLFDPKLGMPRDWDLFSFAAIPVVVLLFLLLLHDRIRLRERTTLVAAVICLGWLVLAARVGMVIAPPLAIRQVEDYIALDPTKGKHALIYLIEYHTAAGDSLRLAECSERWMAYPEERLLRQADSLLLRNDINTAVAMLKRAVEVNPMAAMAHTYLGSALVRQHQCEEALRELKIAEGLSPHHMQIKIGFGFAYFCLGQRGKAEEAFKAALEYGPNLAEPFHALGQFYAQTGRRDLYGKYLLMALSKSNATAPMYIEAGDLLLQEGKLDQAARAYFEGLRHGLDTALIQQRISSHPKLAEYFKMQ